jgi:glycerol-3-phosphate acyltransferase PlsX
MNIALDMMGGDFAPEETIKGVKLFLSQNADPSVNLTLIGDIDQISPHFESSQADSQRIHIVHASEVIEMEEHPTKALKEKPQSSIAIGFHLLATGNTDAFISAGNTGAMLVGSLYSIKAINGDARPAIGAYMPRDNGKTSLLVDVGLNADCKPENLSQFALLGSLFAKYILNFDNPRVALINVGAEEGK